MAAVHGQRGRPVAAWENGCIAPSGMLRSSARDMVRFLQANVGAVETPLRPALRLAQKPRYETAAEGPAHRKIGLAWFIDPRTGSHAKNGGTRGSAADVIFDPKRKTAVVVLMNQTRAPAVRLSHQILLVLAGETDPKVPPGLPTDDGPP
jgi:CubicO group peptidase (beta-lactamase class C family)